MVFLHPTKDERAGSRTAGLLVLLFAEKKRTDNHTTYGEVSP
jgi:hypothetical protein